MAVGDAADSVCDDGDIQLHLVGSDTDARLHIQYHHDGDMPRRHSDISRRANRNGTLYIFILSLLTAILALIGIFCFKDMKLQKRIILITMLCTAAATVQAMYSGISYADGNEIDWSVFIGAPVVALLADIAAYRLICSDQKKLRAADRLR